MLSFGRCLVILLILVVIYFPSKVVVFGDPSDGHGVVRSLGLLTSLVIPLILSVFSDPDDSDSVW